MIDISIHSRQQRYVTHAGHAGSGQNNLTLKQLIFSQFPAMASSSKSVVRQGALLPSVRRWVDANHATIWNVRFLASRNE